MNQCMTREMTCIPSAPARKQPINVHAAAWGDIPPLLRELFADGSMLNNAEKSLPSQYNFISSLEIPHHDTETQTQRRRKEFVTVLYPEVALAGKHSNDEIRANNRSAEHACFIQVRKLVVEIFFASKTYRRHYSLS